MLYLCLLKNYKSVSVFVENFLATVFAEWTRMSAEKKLCRVKECFLFSFVHSVCAFLRVMDESVSDLKLHRVWISPS